MRIVIVAREPALGHGGIARVELRAPVLQHALQPRDLGLRQAQCCLDRRHIGLLRDRATQRDNDAALRRLSRLGLRPNCTIAKAAAVFARPRPGHGQSLFGFHARRGAEHHTSGDHGEAEQRHSSRSAQHAGRNLHRSICRIRQEPCKRGQDQTRPGTRENPHPIHGCLGTLFPIPSGFSNVHAAFVESFKNRCLVKSLLAPPAVLSAFPTGLAS